MAGPYLLLRDELGPAVKGAEGATVGWAGHPPYWQGLRVRTEQGMGCI